jgi:uncharacterized membrane protein
MSAYVSMSEDEKETGRVEAFSDGIFAIAITLLVLNMKVPPAASVTASHTLFQALLSQWPVDLSYLLSFLTVLIMWMNHHKLFLHIRRSDHPFLLLNGLLLMGVTVVPFPTAVLAEHINTTGARVAAGVYSGTYLFIAILFDLLWRYASHGGRLLAKNHNPESVAAITRQYKFGPISYLNAFLLAFASVWASIGVCMALAAFFALPGIRRKRSPKRLARE